MLPLYKNGTKINYLKIARLHGLQGLQTTRKLMNQGLEVIDNEKIIWVTKGYKGYKTNFVTLVTRRKKSGLQNKKDIKARNDAGFD